MLISREDYREGSALYRRLCEVLLQCGLFSDRSVRMMIGDPGFGLYSFDSGEIIYGRDCYERSLGIVLKGRALIYKDSGSRKVLIGEKSRGEIFGAAALFGECDRYASRIEAKGGGTVTVLVSQELMKRVIESDPSTAVRYICFLSEKIRYLNSRLDIYTGTTPSEKIIAYIRSHGGEAEIRMQKLSRELDIPRATLYRTVEKLENDGVLTRSEKKIKMLL